jgi:DnaK suppressor protein
MIKENDLLKIQETLENERTILMNDIRREKARLDAFTEENPDPLDLADRSRYQEISLKRLEYMGKRLEQVEFTLKRLLEGKYGICARCGKPINHERLEAMPSAAYCIKCQKRQEQKPY